MAKAHWWLALAYEQQHRLSEAMAELQKAAAVSGNSAVFVAALGHAYSLAGERDKAPQTDRGSEETVAKRICHSLRRRNRLRRFER